MDSIREIIAAIKARTDCRALAGELNLPRRWNSFLCPFHDDRDPSLSIRPDGFRCYACGAKGDAVALYRRVRETGFRDALEHLAARCGVALPPRRGGKFRGRGRSPVARPTATSQAIEQGADPPTIDADRRTAIYTWAADAGRLREGDESQRPAVEYLARRGISRATAIRAGLGFMADYQRASEVLRQKFPFPDLRAVGLFNEKGNLRLFKHRFLVPYWIDGEALSLQARNIDWRSKEKDGPKELTIGLVTIPFNADVLLAPREEVYVCEGAIDTLSLVELGLAAVGIPGASSFRPEWAELFEDAGEVVLALDNDAAGHKGAEQIAGHFGRFGRTVKRLELPEGVKDVNEFLVAQGR